MKLKPLLINKFGNKYAKFLKKCPGLEELISDEIEKLFSGTSRFDERDLVKLDRKIAEFCKSKSVVNS